MYTKLTSNGECINFNSLCPTRYKVSVIRSFLHRAYAVTSSWQLFHTEIRRIKQVLINNGFPINIINVQIRKFLNIKFDNLPSRNCNPVKLFYCSQYSSNYVTEEKKLNNIIKRNIRAHEINRPVSLYIYYRNRKLGSLLIRNKMYKKDIDSRVVYQYTCKDGRCNSASYIGYTTCTLAKRFYTHAQSGSIRLHNKNTHNSKPLTKELLSSTKILYRGKNKLELTIIEALLIKEHQPILNMQEEGYHRILKIF